MKHTLTLALALAGTALTAALSAESVIQLDTAVVRGAEVRPIDRPVPTLPRAIAGKPGFVLVQFEISESGRVSKIEIKESSDPDLGKFARSMVRNWTYSGADNPIVAIQPILFEKGARGPQLLASL